MLVDRVMWNLATCVAPFDKQLLLVLLECTKMSNKVIFTNTFLLSLTLLFLLLFYTFLPSLPPSLLPLSLPPSLLSSLFPSIPPSLPPSLPPPLAVMFYYSVWLYIGSSGSGVFMSLQPFQCLQLRCGHWSDSLRALLGLSSERCPLRCHRLFQQCVGKYPEKYHVIVHVYTYLLCKTTEEPL